MASTRRRWRGLYLLSSGLLAGAFLLSSCALARPFPGILKVGLVAPFSGRNYSTGYSALFAARLALREWNQRGGIGGYRLELVAQDDGSSAVGGYLQWQKLKLDLDVIGVVGYPSDDSLASLPANSDPDAPALITFGPTEPGKGSRNVWTLRLTANDGAIAQFVARWASGALKSSRADVVSGSGEEAPRQAQAVANALDKAGIGVVRVQNLPQDTPDYKTIAQQVVTDTPDLVFFAGPFHEGASLLKQLRQAGVAAVFLGGPGMANPELPALAGADAKGAYYLSLAPHPQNLAQAQAFRDRYRELAGQEPDSEAALAYDATNALLTTAQETLSGSGDKAKLRQNIKNGLASLKDFAGVTGRITNQSQERAGASVYLYRLNGLSFPGELITPKP